MFPFFKEIFQDSVSPTIAALASGGLCGMVHWTAVLPIDVIRNRYYALQTISYADCIRGIYIESGFRGFYRAWPIVMVRAVPTNAAGWWGADFAKSFLKDVD